MIIKIAGILTILLAAVHFRFFKYFSWDKDLKLLQPLNKKIILTIHYALSIVLLFGGFFSIYFAEQLSESIGIAAGINLGFAMFWILRAGWQLFYFSFKPASLLFLIWFLILAFCYSITMFG